MENMKKKIRLRNNESDILLLIEDKINDTQKLAVESELSYPEIENTVKKFGKLGFIKTKKRGKEIIEAKITRQGILFIKEHIRRFHFS